MGESAMAAVQIGRRPLSCLVVFPLLSSGFVCIPTNTQHALHTSELFAKKTLTEETSWRLRFLLNGVPTEKGEKVNEIYTIDVNFVEDSGYEPPQGSLREIVKVQSSSENSEAGSLKIVKSRWQLSEDPDDRKDGLWIWGLFREPLYPFLLLNVETSRVPLSGHDGDFIKPLQLFAQLTHKRDEMEGAILSGADLTVREVVTLKADPFGAATVDVYEEVPVTPPEVKSYRSLRALDLQLGLRLGALREYRDTMAMVQLLISQELKRRLQQSLMSKNMGDTACDFAERAFGFSNFR